MLALIDLDDTLIDLQAAFATWADEFVQQQGLGDGARIWLEETNLAHRQRDLFFQLVRERFRLPASVNELWADYRRRMPQLVRPFPHIHEALGALRSAGWRLVVITNGKADNQLGKLRTTRLLSSIDDVCTSDALRRLLDTAQVDAIPPQ